MSCGIPATIRAPSGNSRRNARQPSDAGAPSGPGTRKQSRPCSSAHDAVISAPLRAGASTTTVASDRPLMTLFRRGNVPRVASTSGASSETTAPPASMIDAASRLCDNGCRSACPEPITAIVFPPARTVAECAAPSMPTASPDTTVAPTATRFVAIRAGDAAAGVRRTPSPDDGDGRGASSAAVSPMHEEDEWRHLDRSQPARVGDVVDRDDLDAKRSDAAERLVRGRRRFGYRSRDRPGPSRRGRRRPGSSGPAVSGVSARRSTPRGDAASSRIATPDPYLDRAAHRTPPDRGGAPTRGPPMRRVRRYPAGDVRAGAGTGPSADRRTDQTRVRTRQSVRRC